MTISFKSWFQNQESSAFTRARAAAAMGTGPLIPLASLHSRSTAPSWMVDAIVSKTKKKKKKKKKATNESKISTPDYSLDNLYRKALKKKEDIAKEIERLKKEIESLEQKDKDEQPKSSDAKKEPKDKQLDDNKPLKRD